MDFCYFRSLTPSPKYKLGLGKYFYSSDLTLYTGKIFYKDSSDSTLNTQNLVTKIMNVQYNIRTNTLKQPKFILIYQMIKA